MWDPLNISKSTRARKLKLKTSLDIVNFSPMVQQFSSRDVQGAQGALALKLKTIRPRYCEVLALGTKISPLGASRGVGPLSVNLEPPRYLKKYKS